MFYTHYNGLGVEEFFIQLGFENYKIHEVKDQNGIFRIKTSGDRDVIATIDINRNYFFVHKGDVNYVGDRDFKIMKDGVFLLKFQHTSICSTYEIVDIKEYITEDNLKLPATDIVDMNIESEEVSKETEIETEPLLAEAGKLQELASPKKVRERPPINFEEIQMAETSFGDNVTIEVKGTKIHLVFDAEEELGLSASKKSTVIASTRGNKTVPGTDIKVGLNVYRAV